MAEQRRLHLRDLEDALPDRLGDEAAQFVWLLLVGELDEQAGDGADAEIVVDAYVVGVRRMPGAMQHEPGGLAHTRRSDRDMDLPDRDDAQAPDRANRSRRRSARVRGAARRR